MDELFILKTLDLFCSTQNMKYFKELPKEVQTMFVKHFQRKSRNAISVLVTNFLSSPYDYSKNICYTTEVSLYTDGDTKILIIGDNHSLDFYHKNPNLKMIGVEKFIKEIVENTSSVVDLFLEASVVPNRLADILLIKSLSGLDKVEKTFFLNFLKIDKTANHEQLKTVASLLGMQLNPYYFQLRAHRVDFRRKYKILDNVCRAIVLKKHGQDYNPQVLVDAENILKTEQTAKLFMMEILSKDEKLNKQIDNVVDGNIELAIRVFIQNQLYQFSKLYYDISIITIDNIRKILSSNSQENIKKLYITFCAYIGLLMDFYAISRMFRTYTPTQNIYSEQATRIIYYAGSFHTRMLELFLGFTKFKKIWRVTDIEQGNDNCVTIPTLIF